MEKACCRSGADVILEEHQSQYSLGACFIAGQSNTNGFIEFAEGLL